jgi:hypothetical protein
MNRFPSPRCGSAMKIVRPSQSSAESTTEGSAFLLWHFSPGDKTENRSAQFLAVCWIVEVRAEADGDLHIALQDATGDKPGVVVVEIPAKPQWCEIRTTVFSWTRTRFPLHIQSTRKLTMDETPIVTVVGKAFWDIGRAPKDQSNRRKRLPDYSVWEIHPAMKLTVQ